MDYIAQYKNFINSHYLNQGVRITVGIALPALVFSFFHQLPSGIVVSLGAMSVSMTDNPGSLNHRLNGMIVASGIVFLVALLTGVVSPYSIALGAFILICCFVFSMIGVYGNRAGSIGIAALLVMVLSISHTDAGFKIIQNAFYVLAGGIWYTLLSLLLYSFRPYKLTQQALGECIQSTAAYLMTKASFYDKDPDYEKNYELLLAEQVDLSQKQDLIRELLFRSRNLVKDSTLNSRILVMIFLDMVDLFETVMTSQQDYATLHQFFDGYDILPRFKLLIIALARDLDSMGLAVKAGRPSVETTSSQSLIKELDDYFKQFRDHYRDAANVEAFIGLRKILDSLHDIADRMHTLHGYTTYDSKLADDFTTPVELERFVTHQEIGPQLLLENCNLKSYIFRHAIRVSSATVAGFIVSKFLSFGHSYWILLTIIVILKPAYSLSKKRNYERLLGTIGGALIGILLLFLFKSNTVLLAFMIVFMIGTYSFIRTQYQIGVLFMTPYVLLLFHLLSPHGFNNIVVDRLIDTGIGSAIAFLANFFILPAWEHVQIVDYMKSILKDNERYFSEVAGSFSGIKPDETSYKLMRKNAFVSLANLSDAFNRMLSEPKSKQKNIGDLLQFVVLNHMLTSHIATLSSYRKLNSSKNDGPLYLPVIDAIEQRFNNCLSIIQGKPINQAIAINKEGIRYLQDQLNALVEERKAELRRGVSQSEARNKLSNWKPIVDQFNFISKNTEDLEKLNRILVSKWN
jgi:uncharacterized membrane protein (TIGR01666 family)